MIFYKKIQLFALYYAQIFIFNFVLSYHIELYCYNYSCFSQKHGKIFACLFEKKVVFLDFASCLE